MALERRIPLSLLRELENQMYGGNLEQKFKFVQNRVDLEVARLVQQGPSVSAVTRRTPSAGRAVTATPAPAGFFDYDDDGGDDEPDGPDAGYEDELFTLTEQLRALQLKIGKGKGGGRGQPKPKAGGGGGRGGRRQDGGKAEGKGGRGGRGDGSGGTGRARVPQELMQKYFETGCFYCGSPDHPRFKCPKLTAVLTERGLRRVKGQWVATPDGPGTGSPPGSQSGEEWYCSMLDGGSDGGSMEAVFSPPPVPAGFEQRPPRARRTAAARFAQAACPCAGAHVGTCGILAGPPCESWPSRFAHPTAWDALGDTAGTSDDEFPELHRALADAVTAETVHERLSRAPKREPQAARKAARRTAVPLPASVQSCFKGRAALNVVGKTRGEQTVRAVVDSGAAESVTPPGVFADPVVPSAMSRAGQSYTSANGSPIANLGRTTVHFRTPDGDRVGMDFQVGEGLT